MKGLGARYSLFRSTSMLALLIAPLAASGQAQAACDPPAPVSNMTVTCTGAVFSAGFDYHASKIVALFGAVEGVAMSDHSGAGTAEAACASHSDKSMRPSTDTACEIYRDIVVTAEEEFR